MTYRGKTDRRFNDWHYTLPRDWWYIDLDGMEVCRVCRTPLLLYELTRNPDKQVTILARLAEMAGIPAVLILLPSEGDELADTSVIQWQVIGKDGWTLDSLGGWREKLTRLREKHAAEHTTRGNT